MTAHSSSHAASMMTAADYYRHPAVRMRIREYCGAAEGHRLTCAYVTALGSGNPQTPWASAERRPPADLPQLMSDGDDIARSMWDTESLIFFLELDYLDPEHPAEPFVHPADAFFTLEPLYRATRRTLRTFGIDTCEMVTGRGYHFSGRIPWTHPVIAHLADLTPEVPSWHGTLAARRPEWLTPTLDERQARASVGLGLLIEHAAHLIMRRAAPQTAVPVVFNGTEVGEGVSGRPCVSIDFSHAGDPLDMRHMRVAYGTYQLHRLRHDLFGAVVARGVPPLAVVPRGRQSLYRVLTEGRRPATAARTAERGAALMPDVAQGIAALLMDYLPTTLAAFHREYYATTPDPLAAWPDTYDRLDPASLAPCVAAPLDRPNDLLLQPARLQFLTRGLMAKGWHPRHIAGLVHSRYLRDCGWGTRWAHQDPKTRAEFDIRVFAGLIATGLDQATDFNCVSAQEKGLCTRDPNCHLDLRLERVKLLERVKSEEPGEREERV